MQCTRREKREERKDGTLETQRFIPMPSEFRKAVSNAEGKQIVFVTIFGSYQTGKSSTLKKLTGDSNIEVGDGCDEKTIGAFVYGPYSNNLIRKRFHMDEIKEDETQIFFVDTEGCNGFEAGGGNSEACTYLLSQLIAPYATLSCVIISLTKPAITNGEVNTMKKILEITDLVGKVANNCNTSQNLINLFTNTSNYIPSQNKFQKFQKKVTKSFSQKIGGCFNPGECIPLPMYDINKDVLKQSEEFNKGFEIFAQLLLKRVEDYIKQFSMVYDPKSAYEMFNMLIKTKEMKELEKNIEQAFIEGRRSTIDKHFSPFVEGIINEQIIILNNKISQIQNEIQNEPIAHMETIDARQICDNLINILDAKLPKSIKTKDIDTYNQFKNKIINSISDKMKEFYELIPKIKEKQIQFLKKKINNLIHQYEQTIENEIYFQKSNINDFKQLEQICSFETTKQNINNEIVKIYNDIKVTNDVQDQINDYLNEKMLNVKNKIQNESREIIKSNKNNIEQNVDKIIDVMIYELENKFKLLPIQTIYSFDDQSLMNYVIKECENSIECIYKRQIPTNITQKILMNLTQIELILTKVKGEHIDLLKHKVDYFLKEKEQNIENKINNSKSTSFYDIMLYLDVDNIHKECNNLIQNEIGKDLYQKLNELQLYINNKILILKNKINKLADDTAKSNNNKYLQNKKRKVDNVFNQNVGELKTKIYSKEVTNVNIITKNNFEENCKKEINFDQIKESDQVEIDNYITESYYNHINQINNRETIETILNNKEELLSKLKETVDNVVNKYVSKMKATKVIFSTTFSAFPAEVIQKMTLECNNKLYKIYEDFKVSDEIQREINAYEFEKIDKFRVKRFSPFGFFRFNRK